ncbi:CHAT domain-containing protein [Ancylomarina salipaludis]|uniref:CHAT domain-containing protein n=1 Tax=Ancylomarina salipaludis TaxID=2501299 RepID=A0A4V1N067_9BACT|nr:CHAT domain-containing tetratricopeptide repeat protein [Ancylomarina salipaludis]RXQ95095.1 CHAT domain-containing protein [Ancylomarina salipaludis]
MKKKQEIFRFLLITLFFLILCGSNYYTEASNPSQVYQSEISTSADSSLLILFNKAVNELRSRNNKGAEGYFKEAERSINESELSDFELLYRFKVNYGATLIRLGKFKDALFYFNSAEAICKKHFGESTGKLAPVYLNMGNIYLYTKDNLKAQKFYEAALFIIENNSSASRWRDRIINNLGLVSKNNRDYTNALKYLLEGHKIKKERNVKDLSLNLCNIGNCYDKLGYDKEADRYFKLSIDESIKFNGEGNSDLASFYLNYAVFHSSRGNNVLSKAYLNKSYDIYLAKFGLKHPDTAHCLKNLGTVYFKEENYQKALEFYQKALVSSTYDFHGGGFDENPNIEQVDGQLTTLEILSDKASTLFKLHKTTNQIKYLKSSLKTYDLCVNVIDQIRIAYQDEESKLTLSANENETFSLAIEVAATLFDLTGNPIYKEIAFKYSERVKAASLRNYLNDVDAKTFGGIPLDLQNLERQLKQDIADYREKIYQERKELQPQQDSISNWRHTLFDLNGEYDQMVKRFETEHPDYYALKYDNSSISIEELQKELKEDEVLIEYALSDSTLYSFALGNGLFEMKKMKLRKGELESSITNIRTSLKTNDFSDNSMKYYLDYISAAHRLYQLMIEPYEEVIENKHLIIIPEGKLAYVPFGVLLKEKGNPETMSYRNLDYLIRHNPISYQNSATIAYKHPEKGFSTSSSKKLLAFAPSYDNVSDTILVTRQVQNKKLYPLPGAKIEVENISKIFKGETYLDEFASETKFKERAEGFDILHLAMHTILDDENPMYSKLVFSQMGDSLNDGLLNTYEIYNMNLKARMVVLSACNSGDGKFLKGEGVMSLARGFFYSGCPSLIMTLWTVEDLSGSKLMSSFYKYLSQSFPKDVALQQAKLDYLESADALKSHPYFWSGYVAIGETQTLFRFSMIHKILMFLGGVLLFGALYFIWQGAVSRKIKKETLN